jgi:hypothetical protein
MSSAARGGLLVGVDTAVDQRPAEHPTLHHDSFRYIVVVSVAYPAPPFQKRDDI